MTFNTIKKSSWFPFNDQLKHLDDGYDWDEGLTDQDEERFYEVVPKLWLMGEVALHKKFIDFMGSFQIRAKSIISWVRIVYTQMSCII